MSGEPASTRKSRSLPNRLAGEPLGFGGIREAIELPKKKRSQALLPADHKSVIMSARSLFECRRRSGTDVADLLEALRATTANESFHQGFVGGEHSGGSSHFESLGKGAEDEAKRRDGP
jgi:hypothetical protein